MPTVRKRIGNRAGRYDRKNEVQDLLQLVFVDSTCHMHLRADSHYPRRAQQPDENENPRYGDLPKLRQVMVPVTASNRWKYTEIFPRALDEKRRTGVQ